MLVRQIRARAKKLEEEVPEAFYKFVCQGKSIIEYAAKGDIV